VVSRREIRVREDMEVSEIPIKKSIMSPSRKENLFAVKPDSTIAKETSEGRIVVPLVV
jgi:hypothetical protein